MSARNWADVLAHAATIVQSYDTPVTLRQLFYRLVSDGTLKNTRPEYSQLSRYTAEARRAGSFPALIDRERRIHRNVTFPSVAGALAWLERIYQRDRSEGQRTRVYLGVEKAGIVEQLRAWFDEWDLPVLPLRGYSSQTFVDEVREDMDGRPAVLIYAGDLDASGEDIDRDFISRTQCFATVQRIALTRQQIEDYDLPPMPGKATDSRSGAFERRHGRLMQVELDALPPEVLRELFDSAIREHLDTSTVARVRRREDRERRVLRRIAAAQQKR